MSVSFTITGNAMYMGSFISPPSDQSADEPVEGNIYYNTAYKKVYIYIDNDWQELGGGSGATGPAGADGADGDSAYDIALSNGFSGEKSDWLASLVGVDGSDGTNGIDGADGAQGPAGPSGSGGIDGSTGAAGATGPIGLTGQAGATGATGPAGADGAQGPAGPVGSGGGTTINSYPTVNLPPNVSNGTIAFDTILLLPVYFKNGIWYKIHNNDEVVITPTVDNRVVLTFKTGQANILSTYGSAIKTTTTAHIITGVGCPDINIEWNTVGGNGVSDVWEINQVNVFEYAFGGSANLPILQMDLNGEFPTNPTIKFSTTASAQVKIVGFRIGDATNRETAASAWILNIYENDTTGNKVYTQTTNALGAEDFQDIIINYMGAEGVNYMLEFDDQGTNGNTTGINNLTFEQHTAETPTGDLVNSAPIITNIDHIATPNTNTQPTMSFYCDEVGTIASSLAILSPSPSSPNIVVGFNTITFDLSAGVYSSATISIYDVNNLATTITLPDFVITSPPPPPPSSGGYDTTALASINKLGWWSAYDVSDFTLDANNNVLTWTDKTGSNDLQKVVDKYATRSSNEGEGVIFNGSSSLINGSFNIAADVPYTLVLVFEKESSASLSWLIDSVDISGGRNTVYSNSQGYITTHRRLGDAELNYSFSIYTNNNTSTNVKDILTINFDGPNNNSSISAYSNTNKNGVFTTGSLGTGEMDGITIGSLYNAASGYGIDGKIYEIIYFDGIVTTAETTTIRDYLTTKWSI